MSAKNDLGSVCSVAEMARAVKLFRARFYHLIQAGVFPPPQKYGGRPMYPLSLQHKCLQIRGTGIGLNGRIMRFSAPRKRQRIKRRRNHGNLGSVVDIMGTLGVHVDERDVAQAVKALYPKGMPQGTIDATVIRTVMRHLRGDCQKSV